MQTAMHRPFKGSATKNSPIYPITSTNTNNIFCNVFLKCIIFINLYNYIINRNVMSNRWSDSIVQ